MSESIIGSLTALAGRYEIGDLIGRGGMAEVYLGRDTRLDRKVAIKLLKPELAANEKFRHRFRQEAQSAARMSHPTVVRVFDAGEEVTEENGEQRTIPYIIIEYVDGRLLRDIVSEGPLPESEAVRIVKGILTALEYSHRAGVVHCDIKPGNVMLTPGGQIKVMDFGIARAVSESNATDETSTIMGTAQYFSPEQARGDIVDSRTDLYSTGLVLFELLTGRAPFEADSPVAVAYRHLSEQPPRPSEIVPGISPAMESVVAKALTKNADLRFQNANEFASALEAALLGQSVDVDDETDEDTFIAAHESSALTTMLETIEESNDSDAEANEEEATNPRPRAFWIWGGATVVVALLVVLVLWVVNINPFSTENLAIDVPNVEGMHEDDAVAVLEELGLRADTSYVHDEAEVGTVLTQSPEPGTGVSQDTAIRLTVSEGPEPSELTNLTGLTVEQAETTLARSHVTVERIEEENHPRIAEGLVIRTDPEAGTLMQAGSSVVLYVSTGLVDVPNVVGQNYQSAQETLEDILYNVTVQAHTSCHYSEAGRVTSQSIAPGAHEQGQSITISYCNASPPPPPSSSPPSDDDDDDDGGDDPPEDDD